MEETGLTVHCPPGVDGREVYQATSKLGLEGHLFRTSGSTGGPKWVHLTHGAIRSSAQSVCEHLDLQVDDVWLKVLPEFHVGGFMIHQRAKRLGNRVKVMNGRWRTDAFREALSGVTVTSLVPTQVYDLVQARLSPPNELRMVLVGGAALADALYEEAVDSGWPLLRTFGMTETCSQLATERPGSPPGMKILPGWEVATRGGILRVKGPSLFSGYLLENLEYQATDEWFETSDRVGIESGVLTPLGRTNRVVKVLGELVDLTKAERELAVVVVAQPDERRGSRLLAVTEDPTVSATDVSAWNKTVSGPERLAGLVKVSAFPRTALGKVEMSTLEMMAQDFEVIPV